MFRRCLFVLAFSLAVALGNSHFVSAAEPQRVEFTRLVAHWAEYRDPGYLEFIRDAEPEVVQFGFYGAHYWSLAHTEFGKGYPAHFPHVGLAENEAWFAEHNVKLHALGAKVVGHFNVKFLVGDPDGPEGPRGFFKFYRDLWDESRLGKKPTADALSLLEVDKHGQPISKSSYSIGKMKEYWGCLNNPDWRAVLKAWVKYAVERQQVDGLIANYFYRHDCHCEHCTRGFKEHLRARYTPERLAANFAIADLETHVFDEIVAWHKPEESTPLRREMLRFSQIANKRAFDEVLVQYGRSLKPDLIVAQWDHLSFFSQISGDERCLLPAEMWGRGEDYLWYSAGASGNYTDLASGYLGEITLQARYVRGMFDDKPFTFGKYENTRIRVAIAELAANGGAPMGFYARFKDPAAREEIVRYYQFLKRYDALYRGNRPVSEVLLVFPRKAVHNGDLGPLEAFKQLGTRLLDEHVLFDVQSDDSVTPPEPRKYRAIVGVPSTYETFAAKAIRLSQFTAPKTVRVSLSRPHDPLLREWDLHLVNYDRIEPAKPQSPGRGIVDEQPRAVKDIRVSLIVPANENARVRFVTPEMPEPQAVESTLRDGRLEFVVPEFLVYGVCRIEFGE